MKDLDLNVYEDPPRRMGEPVPPPRVKLPGAMGVPPSLADVGKPCGQQSGTTLTPKYRKRAGGWGGG